MGQTTRRYEPVPLIIGRVRELGRVAEARTLNFGEKHSNSGVRHLVFKLNRCRELTRLSGREVVCGQGFRSVTESEIEYGEQ